MIHLRPISSDDATKRKIASFYLQVLTGNRQMMKVLSRSRFALRQGAEYKNSSGDNDDQQESLETKLSVDDNG
jgi:hypothetical protein